MSNPNYYDIDEDGHERENDSCIMMFEDSAHSECTDLEGKKITGFALSQGAINPFNVTPT